MQDGRSGIRRRIVQATGGGGYEEYAPLLFAQKLEPKLHALLCLPEPDFRLCRSIFPEINRQMLRNFRNKKTRTAFLLLLVHWHLDIPARACICVWRLFTKR